VADGRISVRIDDELARRFAEYQQEHGLDESTAARNLLARALARGRSTLEREADQQVLSLQARVCATLGRHFAEFQKLALHDLRSLAPRSGR
jgi:hypothetical protein